jgi:hypothetical protein
MKALYEVYEAKTLSEIIGSVGDDTSLEVLDADGKIESSTRTGYKHLDKLFKEYGPKSTIRGLKLEKRFFTTWRYLAEYEGMAGVKNLESLKKMFPPGLEGLDEGDSV